VNPFTGLVSRLTNSSAGRPALAPRSSTSWARSRIRQPSHERRQRATRLSFSAHEFVRTLIMPVSRLTSSSGHSSSRWVGSRIRQRARQRRESAHEFVSALTKLVSALIKPVSRLTSSWGRSSTPWVGSRARQRAHQGRESARQSHQHAHRASELPHEFVSGLTKLLGVLTNSSGERRFDDLECLKARAPMASGLV